MSRSLDDLLPQVKVKAEAFLAECEKAGLRVMVTQTLRTYQEQEDLYAQGRIIVGKIVTNATGGESWHNFGRAFDICFLDSKGKPTWSGPWNIVGNIGRKAGLAWGGDWKHFKDLPHFEYTEGLTLEQARLEHDKGKTSI